MDSQVAASYVRAVWSLGSQRSDPVPTGRVARHLGIANSTATVMLQKLATEGYVEYLPYKGVRLTHAGSELVERSLRRRRLLRRFFEHVLELPEDELAGESERLERCVSERLAKRIEAFLGPERTA